MSVVLIDGYRTTLKGKAVASATTVRVPRAHAVKLNQVGVGNHMYLFLKDRIGTEVVKYYHDADWASVGSSIVDLPVQRAQSGTGARNFPYGACLQSGVTGAYVAELVAALNRG